MGNKYTKQSLNEVCSTRKKKYLIMTKPELELLNEGLQAKIYRLSLHLREERVVLIVGFAHL